MHGSGRSEGNQARDVPLKGLAVDQPNGTGQGLEMGPNLDPQAFVGALAVLVSSHGITISTLGGTQQQRPVTGVRPEAGRWTAPDPHTVETSATGV